MAESTATSTKTTLNPNPKQHNVANSDKKAPLGERAPGAPFAIVGWSYLLVLAIVTIAISVGLWLNR
ncbi:hypothetical protein LOC67_19670 [Stieleria sp. JC731]|uniref:hypothetical protein n=1 Tax=Pirellulaceae TaxID=2691357 RepID=UPI001E4563EF|nr:hypothetical protein [Stieleria sp. JC731]MCC9602775.1 hypothetical protein [Stieleria sp. JC731]